VQRSRGDAKKLLALASAEDPEAAAEEAADAIASIKPSIGPRLALT